MVDTRRGARGRILNSLGNQNPRRLLKLIWLVGILGIIGLSAACTSTGSPPSSGSSPPGSVTPGAATASPKDTGTSDSVRIYQSNTNSQDGRSCQASIAKSTVTSTGSDGVEQSSDISQSNVNSQVPGNCANQGCSQVNVQGNSASVSQSISSDTTDGANVSSSHQSVTSTNRC
jgi:hypothetical protein